MKPHPMYVAARQQHRELLKQLPDWYKDLLAFMIVSSLAVALLGGMLIGLLLCWTKR